MMVKCAFQCSWNKKIYCAFSPDPFHAREIKCTPEICPIFQIWRLTHINTFGVNVPFPGEATEQGSQETI